MRSCIRVFVYSCILFKDQGKQEICKNPWYVVAKLDRLFMQIAIAITVPIDRLQPPEMRFHPRHVFIIHVLHRLPKIQKLQIHNFLHLAHLAHPALQSKMSPRSRSNQAQAHPYRPAGQNGSSCS